MFLLQLYASHVLACSRILRSVFGDQSGRVSRNSRARTCDLDIPDIRGDFVGRCLPYAEIYVFTRGIDEMYELTEVFRDVRDSQMVLRPLTVNPILTD